MFRKTWLPSIHPFFLLFPLSFSCSFAIFHSPPFTWSCIHSIHFELYARNDIEPWQANITTSLLPSSGVRECAVCHHTGLRAAPFNTGTGVVSQVKRNREQERGTTIPRSQDGFARAIIKPWFTLTSILLTQLPPRDYSHSLLKLRW